LIDDFEDFFLNLHEAYRNLVTRTPTVRLLSAILTALPSAQPLSRARTISRPSNLRAGDNVGAVIVNQVNGGSSDVTFAYELVASLIDSSLHPGWSFGLIQNAAGKAAH